MGPAYIVIAAFLWALDGLLRRSLQTLPPLTIVFLEHLVGLLLLLPFLPGIFKEVRKFPARDVAWSAWIALFSGVLGTLWFTIALLEVQFIPFSVVFLLQKLQPVFVFLASIFFLGERPKRARFYWSAVAIVAAYFVTFPLGKVDFNTGAGTVTAALYALGAAFAWGTSTVFSRLLLQNQSYKASLFMRFALASVIAGLLFIAMPAQQAVVQVSFEQMRTLFLIALSTGMVALGLYYKGLAKTSPSVATVLELVFPVTAVLIDVFANDVVLHTSQYIAALVLFYAATHVVRLGKDGLPMFFRSVKVKGDGRGKQLGFPTINLHIPWNLVLTSGIYACWITIDGTRYAGALHFGSVPTFDKVERTLEIYVLTDEDLPNEKIKKAQISVEVVSKLREVIKFEDVKDLKKQIAQDVDNSRALGVRV